MDPTPDELAGVVDLFGGLTRSELREALAELAFKRGADLDEEDAGAAVEAALDSYHLVAVPRDGDDDPLLVAGPTAFPDLPEGAADLPHILDAPDRTVDRERAARAAQERLRADAARAVEAGDDAAVERLLDASYDLEAWGPVDLSGVRSRLDGATE